MKTALLIAASFVLSTSASFAADCKDSCSVKKVSLLSKLFHKKLDSTKKSSLGDTDMTIAGTSFIIN